MENRYKINHLDVKRKLKILSEFIDDSKVGYTRRPFTKWNMECRDWLINEMKSLNLEVEIDASSNIIGTLKGIDSNLPPIMIGSHTDSVVGGGMFDGQIGVIAGLEIVSYLKQNNISLLHSLKIVDFTAEEASEFGISTIGSRGMVGNLTKNELNRKGPDGKSLNEGMKSIGGNPEKIKEQALKEGDISLFLELHIEQGPLLEKSKKDFGIVTGFVGIRRYRIEVIGQPNHAGTTPMSHRKDALTAASEIVLAIEEICNQDYEASVVGTVGRLNVEPNGPNIVPGSVCFDVEIRSIHDKTLDRISHKINQKSAEVKKKRGIEISLENISAVKPIKIDDAIIEGLEMSACKVGNTLRLSSGAGHDGVQISKIAPVGMIFVPSKDGKSHCPEEWTDYEQVALGIRALLNSVFYFDDNIEKLLERRKGIEDY